MGSLQAMEMAALGVELDTALTWHLRSNHYPPLPLEILEPAKQAIQFANEGQWDAPIALPEGTTWRHQEWCPTWAAVEGWHLDAWISEEVL